MSAPIIITVPNNYLAMEEVDSKVMVDVPATPSRKRRLDHLSWEEKMQRKKLKNRVAAQTSRDRKKARMDEMEYNIKQLMEANEKLTSEVASLKALNERLLSENTELRSAAAARNVAGGPGPAESTPQQKEGPPEAHRAARMLLAMILLLQTSSPTSIPKNISIPSINLQNPSSKKLMQVAVEHPRERTKGAEVVGPAAKQLEPSEGAVADQLAQLDHKHDVHRILSQHSYAHPYTDEHKQESNDKGDLFYASCDDENDCVTVEVPCEQEAVEDAPITVQTDFRSLTDCGSGITLECDMKLLSPMSLSPNSVEENMMGVSPSHTLGSDTGYESLASPLSESESLDMSDFWCESLSELFPGLA
ncbi:hypothetical protein O0L34_g6866 [Tuta absoluta]|nr:hypothetical protein O0L34_g6866 [Tuta absoluta]